MFYYQSFILLIVPIQSLTNLICNGDFQNYPATTLASGSLNNPEYFDYLETNNSCWIKQSSAIIGTTTIQIKTISTPYWPVSSKVADTVSYDKYSICQNISLRASSKYTMKYSVALDPSIINTTFTFYVNSNSILSKIYTKLNYVYSQTVNFTTNKTSNYICLTPDLINYNISFSGLFPSMKFGPIIDNVSLYLTSDLVNSTTNTTINSTANATKTNSTNSTTNSTNTNTNSTANSTANSTKNTTNTNSTAKSTNSTTNFTTNSTGNSTTVNSTMNSTSANSTNSVSNLTTNTTINSTNNNITNSTITVDTTITNTTANSTTNSTTNINMTNNTSTNYSTNSSITNSSNSSTDSTTGNSSIFYENITNNSSGNQTTTNSTNINSSINNSSTSIQNTSSSNSSINQSSSTNASIDNTSNSNSSNNTQSNSSIIIPEIPPFIPSITQQIIQVNFKSQISSLSENIVIVSDFKIAQYGLPIDVFSYLRVQIQQNVQNNIYYYTDINGNLCVSFLPQSYYDSDTFSDSLKVYIPNLPQGYTIYTFQVVVDGKNIQVVTLTESQKKLLDSATSTMETISKVIQKSFLVINSVSCSYFLISLLGFYNLSLMYIFIKLKTLPNFARIFLNTLAYVFFSKGSVTEFIKETFKIEHQINWFDFPIAEKMESHKEQFIWFGVFGNSSNFMLNNFESLVLLSFLFVKLTLLKIVIKILPQKLKQQLDVKPSKFYQHFLGQLSCFVPFFVVSSTECLIEMGESHWDGQLNNLVQIFVFFLFLIITIIGFCLVYQKENRKLLRLSKLKMIMKNQKWIADTQKHKKKKSNILQKYSYYLLCFLIPFTVIIGYNIIFFILISPIIAWRFYNSIISLHRKKSLQNIFKLMNKIVWVVYHFGFFFLYIVQLLKIDTSQKMLNMIKYIGFILIFCVLIGAVIDILEAVISAIMAFVKFIKSCCKNNKINPSQQLQETNKKNIEEEELQRADKKSDKKKTKKLKKTERSLKNSQKIGKKGTLKVKFYKKEQQQREENVKMAVSMASAPSQPKLIVKMKNSKIKNASENKQITNKKLKIKQLQ